MLRAEDLPSLRIPVIRPCHRCHGEGRLPTAYSTAVCAPCDGSGQVEDVVSGAELAAAIAKRNG